MQKLLPPLPFFFVGRQLANDRIRRYRDQKHELLSNAINKPDTKSIWYTKDHIVTLLREMEYLGANGLRIYLGAYDDAHEYAPGQTCLIMVPTRYNGKAGGGEDIITEEEPGYNDRQMMPKAVPVWTLNGSATTIEIPKEYNYGAPCPPVCNDEGDSKFPE